MFTCITKWVSFVKLSHTVFALPFALASMVVAARDQRGWPGWRTFGLILAAMVCARTCAMSFNRIVDRHFDKANPRTASRHLATGAICFYLSPVALFVVCFYSLTKRFTDFTHIFLGLALALAPIGAWLAVKGIFDFFPVENGWLVLKKSAFLPVILAAAVVFWLIGFDIIYALQDYQFDREHGLHSLVVRWGPENALKAAFLSHLFMWGLLAAFGLLCGFRVAYLIALVIILGSLLLEHWLAWRRSLKWINTAFFRLNALISVVFLVAVVTEVVFPWFRFMR